MDQTYCSFHLCVLCVLVEDTSVPKRPSVEPKSELGYLITQQVHKKMQVYNLHYLRLWFLHFYSRSSTGYLSWSLMLSIDHPFSAPSKNHKSSKYTTFLPVHTHHTLIQFTLLGKSTCNNTSTFLWKLGVCCQNCMCVEKSEKAF